MSLYKVPTIQLHAYFTQWTTTDSSNSSESLSKSGKFYQKFKNDLVPLASTISYASTMNSTIFGLPRKKAVVSSIKFNKPDVCLDHVSLSDTTVEQHALFAYHSVSDPGIVEALEQPTKSEVYPEDGLKLYLHLCETMNTCPVGIVLRNLVNKEINLSYYGLSNVGVHAIAKALKYNKHVKRLNLTENFLDDDACYHIGEIFKTNNTLNDLDLTGCRIGSSGVIRVCGPYLMLLKNLNLSRNSLGDEGGEKFATLLSHAWIQRINLSKNFLGRKTAESLTEVFKQKPSITHLDLSWNNFVHAPSTVKMLESLSIINSLEELNLAWNSLKGEHISQALSKITLIPTLEVLNLQHNRFCGKDVELLTSFLTKARRLKTLDLSFNPMKPEDPDIVISKMLFRRVTIDYLGLQGVCVSQNFLNILSRVKKLKYRAKFKVEHGEVTNDRTVVGPDEREIILKRANYLGLNPGHQKNKADVIAYFLKLSKEYIIPEPVKSLQTRFGQDHIPLDVNFVAELSYAFPGPVQKKDRTVNFSAVAEYIRRLWPEKLAQQDSPLKQKRAKRSRIKKDKEMKKSKTENVKKDK